MSYEKLLKMKEDFLSFINGNYCTNKQFLNAKAYYVYALSEERLKFNETIKRICGEAFNYLVKIGSANLDNAQELFSKYGFNTKNFRRYFNQYYGGDAVKRVINRKKTDKINKLAEQFYDTIESAFWDNEIIKKLAYSNNISIEDFEIALQRYALSTLKMNMDDFNNKRTFAREALKAIKGEYALANPTWITIYYDDYASDREKNKLKRHFILLFSKIKERILEGKSIDEICSEFNILKSSLTSYVILFADRDKILIEFLFKKYFEIAEELDWNVEKIKKTAKDFNDNSTNIYSGAILYGKIVKNIPMEEYIETKKYNTRYKDSKNFSILSLIIIENDPEKLYSLFSSTCITSELIKRFCDFKQYSLNEQIIVRQNIEKKLLLYRKRVLGKNKQDNSSNKISANTLLYKVLANYIMNGIVIDSQLKPFDYIDLYLVFEGKININTYVGTMKGLTAPEKTALSEFLAPFKYQVRFNKESFLKSYYEVNLQKDQDGNLIPGSGYVLSDEDKIAIIEFMEQNNMPKLDILLKTVINRYLDGTLPFNTLQSNRA